MAVLLTLLLCLGAAYALVYGSVRRLPAAAPLLRRGLKPLALLLLAFSVYALLHFADAGAWIFLTCALLARGLWTLPLPEPDAAPGWRAHVRPWLGGVLLLALPGIVLLSWIDMRRAAPMAAAASVPAEASDVAATSSVFYPLGPRPTAEAPRLVQRTAPVPAEPVEAPTVFWRLVERFSPTPHAKPAATVAKRAPDGASGPRAAAKPGPSTPAPPKTAPSAPTPAGVNPVAIERMLARAETLLQQGKPQEAAAVAANVLAFDPANVTAKQIRTAAGLSANPRPGR